MFFTHTDVYPGTGIPHRWHSQCRLGLRGSLARDISYPEAHSALKSAVLKLRCSPCGLLRAPLGNDWASWMQSSIG